MEATAMEVQLRTWSCTPEIQIQLERAGIGCHFRHGRKLQHKIHPATEEVFLQQDLFHCRQGVLIVLIMLTYTEEVTTDHYPVLM